MKTDGIKEFFEKLFKGKAKVEYEDLGNGFEVIEIDFSKDEKEGDEK